MAYSNTVDERYLGGFIGRAAGDYDAPGSLNASYVLAAGDVGYGEATVYSYVADVDVYALGSLAPGFYRLSVSDLTWDFARYDTASIASVALVDAYGSVVTSRYSSGALEFRVDATTSLSAVVRGVSYGDAQYSISYVRTGDLPLPLHLYSSVSAALGASQVDLTLTGYAAISGIGNARDNIITGNGAANTLWGEGGHDRLYGGAGNDILYGGAGVDLLDGGTGADRMTGGADADVYVVDNVGDVVSEASAGGVDEVVASVSWRLNAFVENLTLTGRTNLAATGNDYANTLTGNAGNNVILGGGGADKLIGEAGNDVLNGGAARDQMSGGAGDDTYVVDDAGDRVTEGRGAGQDLVQSSVSYALGANLEALTLSGKANVSGFGNGEANVLRGNAGRNTLDGGAGADLLRGGAGDDRLLGGTGKDTLYGDAGADVFAFRSAAEAGRGSDRDVIRDFRTREDHVDLRDIDANTHRSGDQAFRFVGDRAFTGAEGELRFADKMVSGDVDGDGRADFWIELAGVWKVASGDFFL